MSVQFIEKNGKPEWAILPFHEYQRLIDDAQMLEDIHDYDQAQRDIAAGAELVSSEVAFALLDGANPIRVWREFRGLTQQQLAEKCGISKPYLSQIEQGKRTGSPETLRAIAHALNLSLDDVVSGT